MQISKCIMYKTEGRCPTLLSLYAMNILLFKKLILFEKIRYF